MYLGGMFFVSNDHKDDFVKAYKCFMKENNSVTEI